MATPFYIVLVFVFSIFDTGLPLVSCVCLMEKDGRTGCCEMQTSRTSSSTSLSLLGRECCKHRMAAERSSREFMEEKSPLTPRLFVLLSIMQPFRFDRFTEHTTWQLAGLALETIPRTLDIPIFTSSLLI